MQKKFKKNFNHSHPNVYAFVEATRNVQTDAKMAIRSSENLEPYTKEVPTRKGFSTWKNYKNTIDQLTQKKNNNFAVCSKCFIPE